MVLVVETEENEEFFQNRTMEGAEGRKESLLSLSMLYRYVNANENINPSKFS